MMSGRMSLFARIRAEPHVKSLFGVNIVHGVVEDSAYTTNLPSSVESEVIKCFVMAAEFAEAAGFGCGV